jgi:hypothetical protein
VLPHPRPFALTLGHICLGPHLPVPESPPTELRVLYVRDATLRAPAIRCTAGYTKWAVENHHAIAYSQSTLRR